MYTHFEYITICNLSTNTYKRGTGYKIIITLSNKSVFSNKRINTNVMTFSLDALAINIENRENFSLP